MLGAPTTSLHGRKQTVEQGKEGNGSGENCKSVGNALMARSSTTSSGGRIVPPLFFIPHEVHSMGRVPALLGFRSVKGCTKTEIQRIIP